MADKTQRADKKEQRKCFLFSSSSLLPDLSSSAKKATNSRIVDSFSEGLSPPSVCEEEGLEPTRDVLLAFQFPFQDDARRASKV